MKQLKNNNIRAMIQYIRDNNGNKSLIGCEVGVWKGDNALNILQNLNIETLYLIDPFRHHCIHTGRFFSQDCMDVVLIMAIVRLMPLEDKWRLIRKPSCKGCNHVPDNLDFVYIDTIHTYQQIKKDIGFWYPKIKIGGILGGHDYSDDSPGVIVGVDEFVEKHNLVLFQEGLDWWVIKKRIDGYVFEHNCEWELIDVSLVDKINPFKMCDNCGHFMIGKEKYCHRCRLSF